MIRTLFLLGEVTIDEFREALGHGEIAFRNYQHQQVYTPVAHTRVSELHPLPPPPDSYHLLHGSTPEYFDGRGHWCRYRGEEGAYPEMLRPPKSTVENHP